MHDIVTVPLIIPLDWSLMTGPPCITTMTVPIPSFRAQVDLSENPLKPDEEEKKPDKEGNPLKPDEEACVSLAKLLAANTTLTELSLRSLGISHEGLGRLKAGLKINTSLVDIDLSENLKIGDKGELSWKIQWIVIITDSRWHEVDMQ